MDRMEQLFDLLDQWRHFPAYQLERRADVLFALYLPAFLSDQFNVKLRTQLIPEFPVRNLSNNRSCKVDYVALSDDGTRVFFIELKTDGLSRRQRQDDYLVRAKEAGMPALVEGLLQIFDASGRYKPKCYHLLKLVESHGLVRFSPRFHDGRRMGWRAIKASDCAEIRPTLPEISIHYLQPKKDRDEIAFDTFADWMTPFNDPQSKRFSKSLREWAKVTAGQLI